MKKNKDNDTTMKNKKRDTGRTWEKSLIRCHSLIDIILRLKRLDREESILDFLATLTLLCYLLFPILHFLLQLLHTLFVWLF